MMTVEVWNTGFRALGHAGYADAGEDIVCAGISAVLQTAALGFTEVLRLQVELRMAEGNMLCLVQGPLDAGQAREVKLLLETMAVGLKSIDLAYPGHMKLVTGGEKPCSR